MFGTALCAPIRDPPTKENTWYSGRTLRKELFSWTDGTRAFRLAVSEIALFIRLKWESEAA